MYDADAIKIERVPTLGEIIPKFIELYARPRNRDWKGTERILTKFSFLNSKPITEIRRGDVVQVLDKIIAGERLRAPTELWRQSRN